MRFAQISFEKLQAATFPFSKEFCENLGSLLTNREDRDENSECTPSFEKLSVNSKALGVKRLRIH